MHVGFYLSNFSKFNRSLYGLFISNQPYYPCTIRVGFYTSNFSNFNRSLYGLFISNAACWVTLKAKAQLKKKTLRVTPNKVDVLRFDKVNYILYNLRFCLFKMLVYKMNFSGQTKCILTDEFSP